MLQALKGATRLAVFMLVAGVTSAFGAMYTFDLTSGTRTVQGTFVIGANEDSSVQIQLSSLVTPANIAGNVVMDTDGTGVTADGQGGGSSPLDDIEGGASAEALIITPITGSAFAVESVTFTNTESGDDAFIYLDDPTAAGAEDFDIDIDSSNPFVWNAPASTTFNSTISFRNSDGNDDFKIGEIVLDITVGEVPEPSTWTLFGIGIAGLAWLRRRKRA